MVSTGLSSLVHLEELINLWNVQFFREIAKVSSLQSIYSGKTITDNRDNEES